MCWEMSYKCPQKRQCGYMLHQLSPQLWIVCIFNIIRPYIISYCQFVIISNLTGQDSF